MSAEQKFNDAFAKGDKDGSGGISKLFFVVILQGQFHLIERGPDVPPHFFHTLLCAGKTSLEYIYDGENAK